MPGHASRPSARWFSYRDGLAVYPLSPAGFSSRLSAVAGHAGDLADVAPLRPQSAYIIYLRHV